MQALVLTYHSIGEGPPPLCVPPALFERHAETIARSGVPALTVTELARGLHEGGLPPSAVVITFDDGFADTVEVAAPVLARHGLPATVFAVSGHLGASSDWRSQPAAAPRRTLADAKGLASLVRHGWEIGSHTTLHDPLGTWSAESLVDEGRRSREALERAVGVEIRSFAYPYGIVPPGAAAALADAGYLAACTTRIGVVRDGADPFLLPRVDAHYLRRPALLAAALCGRARPYLATRRVGSYARRRLVADHGGSA